MARSKNLKYLSRPVNEKKLWWRDKKIKIKIKSDNIEDFEKQLVKLYGLSSPNELKINKIPVRVKFGLKVSRGTFVVDIAGNLGNLYLELIDMGRL